MGLLLQFSVWKGPLPVRYVAILPSGHQPVPSKRVPWIQGSPRKEVCQRPLRYTARLGEQGNNRLGIGFTLDALRLGPSVHATTLPCAGETGRTDTR